MLKVKVRVIYRSLDMKGCICYLTLQSGRYTLLIQGDDILWLIGMYDMQVANRIDASTLLDS